MKQRLRFFCFNIERMFQESFRFRSEILWNNICFSCKSKLYSLAWTTNEESLNKWNDNLSYIPSNKYLPSISFQRYRPYPFLLETHQIHGKCKTPSTSQKMSSNIWVFSWIENSLVDSTLRFRKENLYSLRLYYLISSFLIRCSGAFSGRFLERFPC